jgi:hypothetical protein
MPARECDKGEQSSCPGDWVRFQAAGCKRRAARTSSCKELCTLLASHDSPKYPAVVETVGLELGTHHPIIEPISASRRERDFRPQRQGRKCRLFAGGDHVHRLVRFKKPLFWRENATRANKVRALETGWWRMQSSETGLQLRNREFFKNSGSKQALTVSAAADQTDFLPNLNRLD